MIRIPLTGFDRLEYAAWCTLRICPDDFPASCFECLAETAGYIRGGNGPCTRHHHRACHRSGHLGQSQPSCFARCKRRDFGNGVHAAFAQRTGRGRGRWSSSAQSAMALGVKAGVDAAVSYHSLTAAPTYQNLIVRTGCDGPACRPRKPLDRTAEPRSVVGRQSERRSSGGPSGSRSACVRPARGSPFDMARAG